MTQVYDPNNGGRWTSPPPLQGGPPAPAGVQSGPGGSYLRGSAPTVEQRANSLMRSDSDYMKIHESKGKRQMARTGLMNSTLAAQASRQGAMEGVLPIATADAQLQAQADAQNVDALNASNIANLQAQAMIASHGGGGQIVQGNRLDAEAEEARQVRIMRLASELNINEADAARVFDREMSRETRGWQSGEAERDRGITREGWGFQGSQNALDRGLTREEWGVQAAEADRQRGWTSSEAELDRRYARETMNQGARNQMYGNVVSQMFSTIFSSPDFFGDQRAVDGFTNFFGGQFMTLFDRLFGGSGGTNRPPGGG